MPVQLYSQLSGSCRREDERRQARLTSLFYGLIKPRRKKDQRGSNSQNPQYADIHGAVTFLVVLSIMLLCIADSFFTLILIGYGSHELNPFLAWALEKDVMLFYGIKYVITAFCVYVVMMHKSFTVFGIRGHKILVGVLFIYALLISYQLSMLSGIYPGHL